LKGETTSNSTSTEQMPDMKSTNTNHAEKQKALHSIRQVLENYSDDAIRRILGPTAISSPINEELEPVEIMTTPSTSTNDHKFHDELSAKLMEEDSNDDSTTTTKPKSSGVMRIRADIRYLFVLKFNSNGASCYLTCLIKVYLLGASLQFYNPNKSGY
jgi:hypothetical protein